MCRKAVRESKLMFDSNFHPTLGVSLPSFLAIQSKVLSSKSRSLWGRLNFWVLRDNITGFVSIDSKVKWFCLFQFIRVQLHQYVYGKKKKNLEKNYEWCKLNLLQYFCITSDKPRQRRSELGPQCKSTISPIFKTVYLNNERV